MPIPPLTLTGIHVWAASLNVTAPRTGELREFLSKDELERANRLYFDRDRNRFIAGRGILRSILAGYLHTKEASIRFCYNAYGKPMLDSGHAEGDLHFNVSHSNELFLCALCRNDKIGIDGENIHTEIMDDEIAKRFFTSKECEWIKSFPYSLQQQAFYKVWVRKEAYLKAMGTGLSIPLNKFDVSLIPEKPVQEFVYELQQVKDTAWFVEEIDIPSYEDYVVAIARKGKHGEIATFKWNGV